MLTTETLPALREALRDAKLDGWLLFDFHGINPIARGMFPLEGMTTRRWFVYVPAEGEPVAITHAIEQGPWHFWPSHWRKEVYSSWRSLEAHVASVVQGQRVAMEYSPGDAVPYVDRVPAGVVELVRNAGGTVVSSGELVTQFYATLSEPQLESHKRSAEAIRTIAHAAFRRAGELARAGTPTTEFALAQWIREAFERGGMATDHGPDVAIAPNAANPHYEPTEAASARIEQGMLLLIDLWAFDQGTKVWADQTWMGVLGTPTARMTEIWTAVRDARDAAIDLVLGAAQDGHVLRGAEVDDAARGVITARGFGEQFFHRTGHSIDARSLHGAGPHLDNLESREERTLIPGLLFSIEPGIYIPGEIGVRSEVNCILQPGRAIVTPTEYQRDLILA